MKFATNIKIDIILTVVFPLLVISGIFIHVTDENANHALWHAWAVAHVIAGLLFLILAILHIKGHWSWFRTLLRLPGRKSNATLILTPVFFFESLSGIWLLAFTEGGGSHTGLWHWWGGLLMTALALWHLWGRRRFINRRFINNQPGRGQ